MLIMCIDDVFREGALRCVLSWCFDRTCNILSRLSLPARVLDKNVTMGAILVTVNELCVSPDQPHCTDGHQFIVHNTRD